MASLVQNNAKRAIFAGEIDLNADDIRLALVMSDTTADTEDEETVMSGFADLDESDDTSYARVALAGEAVNLDNPNDRAEFDATDVSFSGLDGNASRDYVGVVVYKHVTNDGDSIPIAFVEFPSPIPKESSQVNITWNAEGILQLL